MADFQQNPAGDEQSGPEPEAPARAAKKVAKAAKAAKKAPSKAAAKAPAKGKTQSSATDKPSPRPSKAAKTSASGRATKAAKTSASGRATKAAKSTAGVAPVETPEKVAEAADTAAEAAEAPARTAGAAPPVEEPAPAPAPPARIPVAVPAPPPGAWLEAAWETVWQADQPPQRLAELAVAEFGPRAGTWVGWLRETYPGAPAHGIVRLATHQARRAGWALAAVDAAGPLTAALHLPASATVKAMLVLRIAAAYGHDPADPARVGDLLTLLGDAAKAGSEAGSETDARTGSETGARTGSETGASAGSDIDSLTARLAPIRYALTRLGRRRLRSPLGLLRVLNSVSEERDELLRLAHRAARHYRRHR